MLKICLATRNSHKIREIIEVSPKNIEFISLDDIRCREELPETGNTIPANSLQKAMWVWENYGVNCLADDSGLEIVGLNGAPGVHSAYYAGTRDFDENIALVLQNMLGRSNRKAAFKTVMTLVIGGEAHQFEGRVEGEILHEKRGKNGFGYDPIFLALGEVLTFAEMSISEKNKISHRSNALQKVITYLESV